VIGYENAAISFTSFLDELFEAESIQAANKVHKSNVTTGVLKLVVGRRARTAKTFLQTCSVVSDEQGGPWPM
jgi:hypothetical protein